MPRGLGNRQEALKKPRGMSLAEGHQLHILDAMELVPAAKDHVTPVATRYTKRDRRELLQVRRWCK